MKKLSIKQRWLGIILILMALDFARGKIWHSNFAVDVGIPVLNSEVVMDEDQWWLTSGINYFKASLTPERAREIMLSLKGRQESHVYASPKLTDIPTLSQNPQWTAQSSKNFTIGSFDFALPGEEKYPHFCIYIFTWDDPNHPSLSIYAWCPYN